jgi:glycosyltransferase involved in cell wall biosynthesis
VNILKGPFESVLAQTFSDYEMIVVDDGSTDSTPQVVQAFSDQRICSIRQENRGLSGARNTGIRNAAGQYLTFLDSDDLLFPEKLALLMARVPKQQRVWHVRRTGCLDR